MRPGVAAKAEPEEGPGWGDLVDAREGDFVAPAVHICTWFHEDRQAVVRGRLSVAQPRRGELTALGRCLGVGGEVSQRF